MEKDLNKITYEYVGIDPEKFYQGRFAGWPAAPDYLNNVQNKFDIEYDRARFLVENLKGPNILDVGCGSAPYGNTIRSNTNVRKITGIDLDEACVRNAKQSYDEAFRFTLSEKLLFPDTSFDSVFSVDVFGHIEFRHKDNVIQEIARITKPEGISVHVIECGVIDYLQMDPNNINDPIREYVWQEGHIGIECAADLLRRWERFFNVRIENAFIFPLAPLAAFETAYIPESLRSIIMSFDDRERKAAQILMGYVQQNLRESLRNSSANLLFPDENHPLSRHSGLVYLTATHPRPLSESK